MTVRFTNVTYESKLVHCTEPYIPMFLKWYEAEGWHCSRITAYGSEFKELWLSRAIANEGYVRVDLPDGRCYFASAAASSPRAGEPGARGDEEEG